VDGFFREAAVPAVPGHAPPQPAEADHEELARLMMPYGSRQLARRRLSTDLRPEPAATDKQRFRFIVITEVSTT
jgi:hypothetical protein